jgi:hypothetical protein
LYLEFSTLYHSNMLGRLQHRTVVSVKKKKTSQKNKSICSSYSRYKTKETWEKQNEKNFANLEICMPELIIDDFYHIVQNCCVKRQRSPLIQIRNKNKSVGGAILQTKIVNHSFCGGHVARLKLVWQVQDLPWRKNVKQSYEI